jgi:hypothetical protein
MVRFQGEGQMIAVTQRTISRAIPIHLYSGFLCELFSLKQLWLFRSLDFFILLLLICHCVKLFFTEFIQSSSLHSFLHLWMSMIRVGTTQIGIFCSLYLNFRHFISLQTKNDVFRHCFYSFWDLLHNQIVVIWVPLILHFLSYDISNLFLILKSPFYLGFFLLLCWVEVQKFSQCIKYIIVEFTPSIIPHSWNSFNR